MGVLCQRAGVKYFRYHAMRHLTASVLDGMAIRKSRGLIERKKIIFGNLQEIKKKLGNIMESIESGNIKAFNSLNRRIEALESEQAEAEANLKKVDFEIDEIKKQTLSADVMSQSFRTFGDILGKAKPQQLKELINRIVEVVEWHEDENDRASGHCRISYFEQPNLQLPIKKISEPDGLSIQSFDMSSS